MKKEIETSPRKYQKNVLSSIKNLLNVLKTESEKQNKKELKEGGCPHTDKPKRVKGMCFYCYNKKGKTKMAYNCEHTDQFLYCQGLCQPCYLHKFYVNNRKIKQDEKNQKK